METLRVGIKYCGNCNPQMNGPALVQVLRDNMPDTLFLPYDDPRRDVLLVVSSCPVDCATRPQVPGPEVSVAGFSVNRVSCGEDELPGAVMRALESFRPSPPGNNEPAVGAE